MNYQLFPHPSLACALLQHERDSDGAHDIAHIMRVWRNVQAISEAEGGDTEILVAATILHDCVQVEKTSAQRSMASRLSAQRAKDILASLNWHRNRIEQVSHAIEAHSFSAEISPISIEAKILQDADRLDAIGFIGIARCFYVAGRNGAALYHPIDPAAGQRTLDDRAYALDHFQTKLLNLGKGFCTATGRAMAAQRTSHLREYYYGLLSEIDMGGA